MARKSRKKWTRLATIAFLAATAPFALADGGALDTTFGTGGISSVYTAGQMLEIVAQPDGKTLACGYLDTGEWGIRRFDAGGSPDAGFGTDGLVRLFGSSQAGIAMDIAVDASGRLVVVGSSDIRTVTGSRKKAKVTIVRHAALVRLNADGSLDTSFGTGGVVHTPVPGTIFSCCNAVVLQPDGRIVVAGDAKFATKIQPPGLPLQNLIQPFVARYLPNGSPDAGFGSGGITIDTRVGDKVTRALAVALQSTGQIVVGAQRPPNSAVLRFGANGAVDAAFPAIVTPGILIGTSVDRFDRIVASGRTRTIFVPGAHPRWSMLVARYTADGSPDTSFGVGGTVTIDAFEQQVPRTDALFQAGDKIVLGAGVGWVGSVATLATTVRLTDAGALDATYGTNGFGALIDIGGTFTWAYDAALAPDGRILLGGLASDGRLWFVARYEAE